MSAPGFYDPFNHISYVELNKRKRGDYQREESERIENRAGKPSVKKVYVKQNGDSRNKKAKLFVWREWKSPGMRNLLEEIGPYAGLDDTAAAIYDVNGRKVVDPADIVDMGTYYVTGDETLLIPDSDDEHDGFRRRSSVDDYETKHRSTRHTSLSAPEYPAQSRHTLYDQVSPYPPTPPPKPYYSAPQLDHPISYTSPYTSYDRRKPFEYPSYERRRPSHRQTDHERQLEEFERYYREAIRSPITSKKKTTKKYKKTKKKAASSSPRYEERYRSRSVNDHLDEINQTASDFDHDNWAQKDREALAKHKQKVHQRTRSNSAIIYNRRDQTHPDAYIVYVFLNGQGMECQFVNFQRSQLEKGMNYVMELIARRFNVNPSRLCNMDGKRISDVSQLMSRGAYVLVPAGQSFRDTWYFLPDNAIDTSSNQQRIEDRSAQRDRLIQKRDKKMMSQTTKGLKYTSKSSKPAPDVYYRR